MKLNAKEISELCLNFFKENLPNRGKPKPGTEWTVFSAIVQCDIGKKTCSVVSAGTGTKCLGESEMSVKGDLLHDSHSEVIAKRAFRLYILDEMEKFDEKSIFSFDQTSQLFSLKKEIEFHFFSTCVPCGDASIFPITDSEEENVTKKPKLDLNRTGAKCLINQDQDKQGEGMDYHTVLGALRTKPGRGERTRSLSCSDKMLKWNCLGWQGSLLANMLQEPIHMKSITICSQKFNKEAMERALNRRIDIENEVSISNCSELSFEFEKGSHLSPNPCSIIYSCHRDVQVAVNGRKEGCIKKHFWTSKARVDVCRRNFCLYFLKVASKFRKIATKFYEATIYKDLKTKSQWYEGRRLDFLAKLSEAWPSKLETWDRFLILQPDIYLLKPDCESELDNYQEKLRNSGYENISLIELHFRDVTSELEGIDFDAVIFTCPRFVITLKKEMANHSLQPDKMRVIFCIGEKTFHACQEHFGAEQFSCIEVKGAEMLTNVITQNYRNHKFLLPSGNLSNNSLKETLVKRGIKVEKLVLYEAHHSRLKSQILMSNLSKPSHQNTLKIVVFLSPSVVETSLNMLMDIGFFEQKGGNFARFIPLGLTTEICLKNELLTLQDVNNTQICSCESNPESLLFVVNGINHFKI